MSTDQLVEDTLASVVTMRRGFNVYQTFSTSTALYLQGGKAHAGSMAEIQYLALGLAGEAGEAVDCVKKMFRADLTQPVGHECDAYKCKQLTKLHQELGDLFWYWTRLCAASGLDPVTIIEGNIRKLASRQEAGTLAVREG